jgi:hypothetical protein
MNLIDQASYSAPVVVFLAIAALAVSRVRRTRGLAIAVLIATVAVAVATPLLRERLARYAIIACGYIADVSVVDLGPSYPRAADGVGRTFAGWTVKSTLQCTPLLALAPLALWRRTWPLVVVLGPCAVLYASLISRANLDDTPDAMGWPWVYVRYTFPALPGLAVASVVVVERLGLRRRDLALALALAAALAIALILTPNDKPLWRRLVLVLLPLLLGTSALAVTLRALNGDRPSRLARTTVALTLGLGIAIGLGHDLRANIDAKRDVDRLVDRVGALVPHRFAMVGYLGNFDAALTTTATHDVEYADALRVHGRYSDLHALLDHWRDEHRPVYFFVRALNGGPRDEPINPWPDVSFERVTDQKDTFDMFLVRRSPPTTP